MLRWILLAFVAGLAALVARFPLSWGANIFVPDDVKLAAPDLKYHGTIWSGTASGLPLFGTANFKVQPLKRTISVESGNGRNYFAGELGTSHATDLNLRMDLLTVPFSDGRLQGLLGEIAAIISEAEYTSEACLSATGRATTDVLQRNGGAIQWTGPKLEGPIRCENGALIADLSGRDAGQNITASISLSPSGEYRADISAQTNRPEADAVLPLFGFTRSGRNFKLTEQGRWR